MYTRALVKGSQMQVFCYMYGIDWNLFSHVNERRRVVPLASFQMVKREFQNCKVAFKIDDVRLLR